MPIQPLYLGECGLITCTENESPLYICECNFGTRPVFSTKEKTCGVCRGVTVRAALDDNGMIMAL